LVDPQVHHHSRLDGDNVYDHGGAHADALASTSTLIDNIGITTTTEAPLGYGLHSSSTLALASHCLSTPVACPRCSSAPKGSLLLDISHSSWLPSGRQMSTQTKKARPAPKASGLAWTKLHWFGKRPQSPRFSIGSSMHKTLLLKVVSLHGSWRSRTP
jgi:hypothetical protein